MNEPSMFPLDQLLERTGATKHVTMSSSADESEAQQEVATPGTTASVGELEDDPVDDEDDVDDDDDEGDEEEDIVSRAATDDDPALDDTVAMSEADLSITEGGVLAQLDKIAPVASASTSSKQTPDGNPKPSKKRKGMPAGLGGSRKGRAPAVSGLTIPFRTVKKAMKLDPDIPIVQNEAAIMTTLASELFLKALATASYANAKARGRNTIR
jgi:histone H3/H4